MDQSPTPARAAAVMSPAPHDATVIAELARMTPAQRLRLNDAAVRAMLKLREAVRRAGA